MATILMQATRVHHRFTWIGYAIAGALLASGTSPRSHAVPPDVISIHADDPAIRFSGRAEVIGTNAVVLGWSGARGSPALPGIGFGRHLAR